MYYKIAYMWHLRIGPLFYTSIALLVIGIITFFEAADIYDYLFYDETLVTFSFVAKTVLLIAVYYDMIHAHKRRGRVRRAFYLRAGAVFSEYSNDITDCFIRKCITIIEEYPQKILALHEIDKYDLRRSEQLKDDAVDAIINIAPHDLKEHLLALPKNECWKIFDNIMRDAKNMTDDAAATKPSNAVDPSAAYIRDEMGYSMLMAWPFMYIPGIVIVYIISLFANGTTVGQMWLFSIMTTHFIMISIRVVMRNAGIVEIEGPVIGLLVNAGGIILIVILIARLIFSADFPVKIFNAYGF